MASIAPKSEKPAEPGAALLEQYEVAEDTGAVPAEKPEPEPTRTDPPEAPPAPKHPAWLARKAKLAGLDEKEIADLSTEDLKDSLLVAADRRQEMDRPRNDQGQFMKQDPVPETDAEFSIDDKRLDEFDPNLKATLTDLFKPLHAEIKSLKKQLADVGERDQARERNAHFDKLDQLFTENEAQFGKGRRERLGRDSKELARRVAVINEMGRIHAADPTIPFDESFDLATERLDYKAKPAAPPPAETEPPDPHRYLDSATLAPSSRNGLKEQKGTKLAVKNLEAAFNSRGGLVDNSEAEELPD